MSFHSEIPLLWITLPSATTNHRRMKWAVETGGWQAIKFTAVDAGDRKNIFVPIPLIWETGARYPGIPIWQEERPFRRTSKYELACSASWQRILISLKKLNSQWFLLMEDDVGSSLAVHQDWPVSIDEIIANAKSDTLAIQLCPISSKERIRMHQLWLESNKKIWLIPKSCVRSHGNGGILLNRRALKFLLPAPAVFCSENIKHVHPIVHPWLCRPVADKWIYSRLPSGSVEVLTYPIFCLDGSPSSVHNDHVDKYHLTSKYETLQLWKKDGLESLVRSQAIWDSITVN